MLVDDHPLMRAGLVQLIQRQKDFEVACECSGPAEALSALSHCHPDLLLTDLTMPGRSGVEFIKDVLALNPSLRILVVSMRDEMVYAERVLRAGARGYLMKEAGGEKLLESMRRVLSGQIAVSERLSARLLEQMTGGRPRGSDSPIQRLSDREFEVFQWIGRGLGTQDIARQLHLSPKTVDVHRGHIKEKLGLRSGPELMRHAVRWVESEQEGG
ncbi:MAG: response regulator transcription factor [Verrucomicrobia bacterium]|nr:response regulator transcription factor [Verrucomicrobiota bacterium]